MSGPAKSEALQFLPSGAEKPARVIYSDGTEEHNRPGAPPDEPATVMRGNLANKTMWDPGSLAPGEMATLLVRLAGTELGDVTFCGLSSLVPTRHHVQLTSMSGEGVVEAMLHNVGGEPVDVGPGKLRVVVMKLA